MATQPSLFKYGSIDIWGNNPTPYTCECGSNTTLGNKFKHNRTLKHQAYLQQEIHRANGTLEEEERKQAIINEKDKADRKERQRVYDKERNQRPDRKEITRLKDQTDYRKEQAKQYRANHKEEQAERGRQYYELNKDRLYQPITCECGSITSLHNKYRHCKSIGHITGILMNNQQLFNNELNNYNI